MSTVHVAWARAGLLTVAILLGSFLVRRSVADDVHENLPETIVRQFNGLEEQLEGFDWEEEHRRITEMIDRVWEQNGWDGEADLYARDLARDVAAIPPWKFTERFGLFSQRITERYRLSPEQSGYFQGMMVRELGGVLLKHGPTIFDQVREVVEVRDRGEPFTAEQVARWTNASQTLFTDARGVADRVIAGLTSKLRPAQRKTLARDVAAFDRRWDALEEMRKRWKAGGWRPGDWGFGSGKVESRGLDASAPDARPIAGGKAEPVKAWENARVSRWVAHDPSTWYSLVLDCQRRYDLDSGQMSAARSIHDELAERAMAYTEPRSEALEKIPPKDRSTHEAYGPVRVLFEQLQERIEAIPTRKQQDQARS